MVAASISTLNSPPTSALLQFAGHPDDGQYLIIRGGVYFTNKSACPLLLFGGEAAITLTGVVPVSISGLAVARQTSLTILAFSIAALLFEVDQLKSYFASHFKTLQLTAEGYAE